MARLSDVYSAFIKADALRLPSGQYGTLTLTIKGKPETSTFDDGQKQRVLSFHEDERQLGLNVTNWNSVAEITGKDDDDYWDGARIELYVDPNVQFGPKRVAAIRIRRPAGVAPAAPSLPPTAPPPPAAPASAPPPPAAVRKDKNYAWAAWCASAAPNQPVIAKWNAAIVHIGKPESSFTEADWEQVATFSEIPF